MVSQTVLSLNVLNAFERSHSPFRTISQTRVFIEPQTVPRLIGLRE